MKTLQTGGAIRAEVLGPLPNVEAALRTVPGVESVEVVMGADSVVEATLRPRGGADPREEIFKTVVRNGWSLRELSHTRTTLEDIFVQITREEDDAEEERREQRRSARS
jgi:ABC-2 type transport system ATP-binding protein